MNYKIYKLILFLVIVVTGSIFGYFLFIKGMEVKKYENCKKKAWSDYVLDWNEKCLEIDPEISFVDAEFSSQTTICDLPGVNVNTFNDSYRKDLAQCEKPTDSRLLK